MRLLLLLGLSACVTRSLDAELEPEPDREERYDLVVVGNVLTPLGTVQAVGIRDGLVVEQVQVDGVLGLVQRANTVLRAPVVTAGFVDAHAHPVGLGRLDEQLVLTGIDTYAGTLAAFADAPGTGWVEGRGWDQNDWSDAPEGGWPLAADLDPITGDRPVAVRRVDGHAVWLNSAAMAASGIDANTPDPEGGRLIRNASGAPTGVLIDEAMALVQRSESTDADLRRWVTQASARMAEAGLTGAHAMGVSDESLAAYTALAEEGALPVRIWAYAEPESDAAQRLMTTGPWSVGHLSVVGVKAFADGALGSRGAWLTDAYSDEPGHHGTPIHRPEQIEAWATALLAQNAGMAVHAIGDRAVHETIEAFAAARRAHPESTGVLRVEHAQVLRPEDVATLVEHRIVASVQPTHATSDMPWAEDRLGSERIDWAYRWRSLLDADATVVFGSDFPVESHRPALGLWAAVNRTDLDGQPEGGWHPEERVTEAEAISAFTSWPASIIGEPLLGDPSAGAADLTLWRREEGAPWTPVATVVDGQVLYNAN